MFSESYLNDLAERLPQAAIHRYAGASHLVTEDAPETAEHAWTWVGDQIDRKAGPEHEPRPAESLRTAVGGADRPRRRCDRRDRRALGDRGKVTSFAELESRVADLAAGLVEVGVRPGDRVALLVRPGLDLTASVYACWRAGAAIVLADAGLGLRNLGSALRSADPDHLIAIPAGMAVAAALRVPGQRIVVGAVPARSGGSCESTTRSTSSWLRFPSPSTSSGGPLSKGPEGDPTTLRQAQGTNREAAVLFTSGATGPAKGVVYRHDQLRAQLDQVRAVMRIGPEDRLVAAFAPFALYGPALGIAAAVPDMDVTRPATLTAVGLAEAVQAVEATVIFASPAALRHVVETADRLDSEHRSALAGVRTVLSAGAPVPVALLRRVQRPDAGRRVAHPVRNDRSPPRQRRLAGPDRGGRARQRGVRRLGGAGRDDPDQRPRCSRPGHRRAGRVGRGDRRDLRLGGAREGTYDRLWATERQSSRNPGWHRTGDVGHVDAAGRLWVEGRLVHVITGPTGPITPVGIEQRVEAVPGVRAAAAVGVGPAGTQQLIMIVVPHHAAGDRWPHPTWRPPSGRPPARQSRPC